MTSAKLPSFASFVLCLIALLAMPAAASTYTRYVNFSTGSDSNNGQTTGTAWLTLAHAISQVATSDNATINVIPGGVTPTDDYINITSSQAGATILVQPNVPGTTIAIVENSGHGGPILINSGLATPTNLTVKNLSITSGSYNQVTFASDAPAMNLTLVDGVFTNTNNSAFSNVINWNTGGAGTGSFTLRRCVFTNFAMGGTFTNLTTMTVDSCRFTSNVNSPNADFWSPNNWTVWNMNDSQFVFTFTTGSQQFLFQQPVNATSMTWKNLLIDYSAVTSENAASLFTLANFSTSQSSNFALSWDSVIIKQTNSTGNVATFGQFDNQSLQRQEILASTANANNKWGAFSLTNCRFINLDNTSTGGGLWVGLGPGENAAATISNCYWQNGNGTAQNGGHGGNFSGDNLQISNCVSVGYLGYILFGNRITVKNCTFWGFGSGLLFGHAGGGTWDDSQNCSVTYSIFVATNNANFAASDYNYNASYQTARLPFTSLLDYNCYFNTAGGPVENIHNTACTTIGAVQTAWSTWGSHPDNDSHSIYANPRFTNTSLLAPAGFTPALYSNWYNASQYLGAIPPRPTGL